MHIKRKIKYYLLRLFRLKANPSKVAAGFMIGLIPHWFPIFGLGPILSIGLAKLVRVNTFSAIVGAILGAPFWPLFFLLNYKIGSFMLNRNTSVVEGEDLDYIRAIHHATEEITSVYSSSYLFLAGAAINILLSSIFIYFVTYILFKLYRVKILAIIR